MSLSFFSFVQRDYPTVLGITANISIQDLLNQTNQKRQENGLPPVVLNDQLTRAAEMKGDDMFAKNYWAHVSPDGVTPWVFIKNAGYDYLYAGENLARGFTTATDTVNAWMASPTHRENLLSPNFKDIGFAVKTGTLTGSETILVVQEFGSKYNGTKDADAPTTVVQPTATPTAIAQAPTQLRPTGHSTLRDEPSGSDSKSFAGQAEKPQVLPSATPLPTELPKAFIQVPSVQPTSTTMVAAIQNNPLVDSKTTKRNISLFVLLFFIVIFIIDAVIIERKKIARLVSHNLDHIIFLTIILIAAIIIGKGLIL